MRERVVFGTVDLPDTSLAPQLLDRFVDGGGRAIDIANVYRDGEASRAVGSWLAGPSAVDVVLYAKGCHPPHCRPELAAAEVDRTRQLLGVDRVDVFVLHRDEPSLPVSAFAEALLKEVAAGRIGGFGVSNWTVARTRELHARLEELGEPDRLVAFSNHFSLGEMVSPPWPDCLAMSKDDFSELADMGVVALAWSSLARGFFAGRDDPSWDLPLNRDRRRRATELAERLGVPASAVALAYVLHQPDHVLPVVGTCSERHLDEALAAADLALTAADVDWLEGVKSSVNP